jgi:hypothetical protein
MMADSRPAARTEGSSVLVKENDDHDAVNILALDLDQAERSLCLEIWLHSVD